MIVRDYLRRVPLFSQMNEEEIRKIEAITKERFYKKDSIIITEGEIGESIFIIRSGRVKIYKTSGDGREVILNILDEGNIFAEVILFNDVKYPATVESIEDTIVYSIYNEDLENLIKDTPEIALEIIKVINKRLHDAQRKIKTMALNDTFVRTAQILIELSKKYGKENNKVIEIDLNITREELAGLVGASRETVSRALSQFNKERSIEIKGRKIRIIDIDKLKEWI